eukprot:CAMPEP_0179204346 /NCGR_PEP_ID=MMETSP0796-20121207/101867_1 /TAXON_ID=73915 /ORGANISM="Pyrodinium bahamense, Strain pbaha01" /LENGTH=194 /DNA_ID=CAMNT_0020909223 /DNA_START=63 /DNA_END=649 /DNA_ORIENTATION=-
MTLHSLVLGIIIWFVVMAVLALWFALETFRVHGLRPAPAVRRPSLRSGGDGSGDAAEAGPVRRPGNVPDGEVLHILPVASGVCLAVEPAVRPHAEPPVPFDGVLLWLATAIFVVVLWLTVWTLPQDPRDAILEGRALEEFWNAPYVRGEWYRHHSGTNAGKARRAHANGSRGPRAAEASAHARGAHSPGAGGRV